MAQIEQQIVDDPAGDTTGYATLLVHAEPGQASAHRVTVGRRLARDLGATLIGLGAETFNPTPTPDPFSGYAGGEWVALVQEQITKNLAASEIAFRRDSRGADVEWRAVQDFPHRALVKAARAADLIVVSPRCSRGSTVAADPADVVMSAGRPVLLVPDGREHLKAQTVLIAWKDSRECRRAIADAMPFLVRADDVIVHAVVTPGDDETIKVEAADVVANLKGHGVDARALVTRLDHEAVETELERVAGINGADLIVAGAYGHSRLREWAFGGVTDSFLHRPGCFVLLSH